MHSFGVTNMLPEGPGFLTARRLVGCDVPPNTLPPRDNALWLLQAILLPNNMFRFRYLFRLLLPALRASCSTFRGCSPPYKLDQLQLEGFVVPDTLHGPRADRLACLRGERQETETRGPTNLQARGKVSCDLFLGDILEVALRILDLFAGRFAPESASQVDAGAERLAPLHVSYP